MKPFILIAGCPRSGTTLIRNMLNAHPEIYIFPQTQFFNKIWGSRRFVNFRKNRKKLLRIIAQDRAVLRDGVNMYSEQNLSRGSFESYYDEYVSVIEDNNIQGKKIVGDKTPRHIFFLNQIIRHMQCDVKTIVAIRDCRAVVASLKKRGMVKSVEQGAAIWNFFLEQIVRLLKELPDDDILCIRYEDLVSEPARITRNLSEFLNLGYSEHMLNISESNSSYARKPQSGIYKDSLYQWQQEFNKDEIEIISQLTEKYLTHFDYRATLSKPSLALKSRLKYRFYRLAEHAIILMMTMGVYPTQGISLLKKASIRNNPQ